MANDSNDSNDSDSHPDMVHTRGSPSLITRRLLTILDASAHQIIVLLVGSEVNERPAVLILVIVSNDVVHEIGIGRRLQGPGQQ